MANEKWPVYGEITGPVVMIGFGSIGRGTLPLIERHFKFDKSHMTVVDPRDTDRKLLDDRGIAFVQEAVTKKNYKKLLKPLLTKGGGQGFCVNLSVDTGSVDLMRFCRELGVLYIDTVVEPWLGFYFDAKADNASRTNYALRETLLEEKRKNPGGATAISTCGANPGMVSWLVKQALLNLAGDLKINFKEPAEGDREGWAKLMKKAGVKGVHIAERDTQRTKKPKPMNAFWNTWSVEGFISEGMQPAELGWGTHEKWMPKNGRKHKKGSKAGIFLEQAGRQHAGTHLVPDARCAIWLPGHPQRGDLDRRFLHRARQEGRGHLSPDLPLRLSPLQRRRAVAARDFRCDRQGARDLPRARRERTGRRLRRARRAALRSQEERLLVRLAADAG